MYLDVNLKQEFIEYSVNRIRRNEIKDYNHLTNTILSKTFDYMINHKLQTNEKGYCWLDNKKEKGWGTLGYIDYVMTSEEEYIEMLFHHMFCEAEYFARVDKETIVMYHGINAYNCIMG